MTRERPATSPDPSAPAHAWIGLALIVVTLVTTVAVGLLARCRPLAARIEAFDLERFRNGEELFVNRGNFLEFEDRLLIDEIPNADYSRGGVYFLGSSNLKWALKTWELPADLRPLVGNYGIGAVSHALELQFLRFLVEERGLLRAGGDRTHVVLGAFWSNALNWPPETYFGPLWRRHGLYTYSEAEGVRVRPMPPFERHLRSERARCAGFIGGIFNRLARVATTSLGLPLNPTERIREPAEVAAWTRTNYAAPNWKRDLADQMRALDELFTYLGTRDVGVTMVLLPYRQAFDELPLTLAYRDEVRRLCDSRSVELVDLSRLLPEDEYWDINHYNYEGLAVTHAALMQVAERHLARLTNQPPTR